MNKKFALILIDVQKGFDHISFFASERNNFNAEENIACLLKFARIREIEIIHVQHNSLNVKSPLNKNFMGFDFKEEAKPLNGEIILEKTVNSAFIGTNLEEILKLKKIEDLFFVGFTLNHCVSTTVRMASNLGFNVFLIEDAVVAFSRKDLSADQMHKFEIITLDDEFCSVICSDEAISMWK